MPAASIHARSVAAALSCVAAVLPAQETPANKTVVALDQKRAPPFVLEAGEHDIRDVVDRAAAYLRRNILMVDNLDVPQLKGLGPTVLQQPMTLDAQGCEEVLASMLHVRGLALIPLDESKGLYEVVSMHGARRGDIMARALARTAEEVLERPGLRMVVTVALPLQHVNATIANNALRPFFASGGNAALPLLLGTAGSNSVLLLCGFQDQVASAIRLLQVVDRPPGPEQTEVQQALQNVVQRVAALEQRLQGMAVQGR